MDPLRNRLRQSVPSSNRARENRERRDLGYLIVLRQALVLKETEPNVTLRSLTAPGHICDCVMIYPFVAKNLIPQNLFDQAIKWALTASCSSQLVAQFKV